jgi:hypothetical protein
LSLLSFHTYQKGAIALPHRSLQLDSPKTMAMKMRESGMCKEKTDNLSSSKLLSIIDHQIA